MVISRRRFGENLKEMNGTKKKHVKGVQNLCFCQLSMQILWRCRCRRVVDLKLSNYEEDEDDDSYWGWWWRLRSLSSSLSGFWKLNGWSFLIVIMMTTTTITIMTMTIVTLWSVFTWGNGGHVCIKKSREKVLGIWLYYYAKLVRHFAIVLYTNMAVLSRKWKHPIQFI